MKAKIAIWLALTMLLPALPALSQRQGMIIPGQSGNLPSVSRALPADSFVPGQIVLKVREGLGPYAPQSGQISFNVPSLDEKTRLYEVSKLEKRFRHRPIPKDSGLPDLSRIYRIRFPESYSPAEVAMAFSQDPNIEYAEPEPLYAVTVMPDDPMYGDQLHLPQIHAPEAWEIHKGEEGDTVIVVAIVDTGTEWTHEDLSENTWQNLGEDADGDGETMSFISGEWQLDPEDLNGLDDDGNGFVDDLIGWDFLEWETTGDGSNPDPFIHPWSGHGSHCSGIAAGRTNNGTGIASVSWNVKYLPVQSAGAEGYLDFGYDGIIYAAEMGADMISCSWGAHGNFWQEGADVVAYATSLGSIVFAAAGNNNLGSDHYPSNFPAVVSVASVNTGDTKADFTNYGPAIDISAPGGGQEGGILSTVLDNQYEYYSGTSMATPMVAGLAALIKSYHPGWSSEQVLAQLLYTADNIDAINPGYEHMLGSGRINAFRALSESGVTVPQELEFSVTEMEIEDEDGDDILEPGEDVDLFFDLRNCNQLFGCEDVTFTLVTDDGDIDVLSEPLTLDVDPDDYMTILSPFRFHIAMNADPHIASFTLEVDAPYPAVGGSGMDFELSIAPSGILVVDVFDKPRDMSGSFIMDCLDDLGLEAIYTLGFPHSLRGYEAVFISGGNLGYTQNQGYISDDDIRKMIIYLSGNANRNLYVESGGLFLGMYFMGSQYYSSMCNLFGVQSVSLPANVHQIGNLSGVAGTIMEDLQFNHSSQLFNFGIDAVQPKTSATITFSEAGYGNVGIYYQVSNRKTFYLSYSLADLEDTDEDMTRYHVLMRVLDYFGYEVPENYVIANFKAENRFGKAPLEVQFSSLSQCPVDDAIISWQWDFDGDGETDGEGGNTTYIYETPGSYDVSLITTTFNGSVDTLVLRDYVGVHEGMFVYEPTAGQRNFSGSYIRDMLKDKYFFPVDYSTVVPHSFLGYDAIFLSHGYYRWLNSNAPDGMVNPLIAYLESGGKVYIEGGDVFGFDLSETDIHPYFGLSGASDGIYRPLTQLEGQEGTLAEGMMFEASNQFVYPFMDELVPGEGLVSFIEDGEANMAVQYQNDTYRTFCMTYALAELADNDSATREELLTAILDFFGYPYTGLTEDPGPGEIAVIISPNPCRGQALVSYALPEPCRVELSIYNLFGEPVTTLAHGNKSAGRHFAQWNAEGLPPGIYLYRLTANGAQAVSGKLVVVN